MPERKTIIFRKFSIYLFAWCIYILFTFIAYPIFSITVMLFSIALSIIGALLYRYPGWLWTTLLTIPFHYLMLTHSSDDPAVWNEAFNPFGICTQLFISGLITIMLCVKDKLDHLNIQLEEKVKARTQDLNRLRLYIIDNHETAQLLLSQMLREDIGDPLNTMLKESETLVIQLAAEDRSDASKATRLIQLIKESIELIQNLRFIDFFISRDHTEFECSVKNLTISFKETAGTNFELDIDRYHSEMPKDLQYQLYRITQEAVTNAIRHGKADLVKIKLDIDDDSYHLTVINNGLGMSLEPTTGLGLKLMHNRACLLQGSISFDTTPDGQTRFNCVAPKHP